MGTAGSALKIDGLEYRYERADNGGWTLSVGSLALSRGEQILLSAGSGKGKSTLLSLIAGLMDPLAGFVEVAGVRVHSLHGAQRDHFRGRHIGMIFQTFNLLHGFSAMENVLAALMFSEIPAGEHGVRAKESLASLGIDRPERTVDRMSVGQQQRVAVARAVVCGPELVLADEPTASLDPENAKGAMDLIQGACRERGAALLCVSHDPGMAARFERREALDRLGGAGVGSA